MNKKKALLIVVILLIVVLVGASVLYKNLGETAAPEQLAASETPVPAASAEGGESESPAPEKEQAPDFIVYDADGNAVRLSDYFGKPIVLNFWASWCGPCKMEMPDFNEMYLELGDEVHFLIVNVTDGAQETFASASAFVEESGYAFPVLYDMDQTAAYVYAVYSLPTTYFIDAEGYAVAYGMGALSMEDLQRGLDMIME